MPTQVSYPGVYIEEIPSGVRTIAGVATSITAFVGRAPRGPTDADTDSPVVINSFGDYVRAFGDLWVDSALGFAVRDFFLNGGAQALVVRLYHAPATGNSKASLAVGVLTLTAAYPGSWGNNLRARVDHQTRPRPDGSADPDTFNLFVRDGATGVIETFRNVSHLTTHPRRIDKVLENESTLVRAALPASRPAKHPDPQPSEDVWGDNTIATNNKVLTAGEASDGQALAKNDFISAAKEAANQGLFTLRKADLFNLLCVPPYTSTGDVDVDVVTQAAVLCEDRRAFLLVDPPSTWNDKNDPKVDFSAILGTDSKNAALFFPRLRQPNPVRDDQEEDFVPCGAVAGIFARTDAERGVWKAPAGLEARLVGVPKLSVPLTDAENGELNPLGVNCLRTMPAAGRVVWGSRTMQGADRLASEWKYVPVRRLALYLEESLYRGLQWVVFEPNDEPLWAQIRLNVGAFLQNLFRQGAFQGQTPRDAYFVKCDKETTTQNDIDLGIVNILVGFAPLKPAEFVIIKLQQMAGQIQT